VTLNSRVFRLEPLSSDSRMSFTVLIPARLASTRLPGKPLADLGGVPMVVRVAQQALQSGAMRAVVAADSAQIMDACKAWGIESILTRTDHPSGSDRLAEACELLGLDGDDIVVNVQGDEPLIDPSLIDAVARLLSERPAASMSTAAHVIGDLDDFRNPNVVKVVLDAQGLAMYFSRAPIAWWRDGFASGINTLPHALKPLRHVGIYGYRAGFLREFPRLSQAPVEVVEALEQLRALWHGHRIAVHVSQHVPGPGVDTPQDLDRVRKLF
jgi:3-deoxy-manno-octulosonate cytidylyltransferase (CMP-KDO synthetase)